MRVALNRYKQYLKIKDRSHEDRPREKLEYNGKSALTKAELLAIVLGSGIKHLNVIDLARQILKAHNNDLSSLATLSVQEFTQFPGVGKARASIIVSVLELASRLEQDRRKSRPKIEQSEDAYELMRHRLAHKVVEEFWVILINNNNEIIKISEVSKGGLSRTIVDTRVVLKHCILHNAIGFVLVHNHPAGNSDPSSTDIELTNQIKDASYALELKMLDHIIIARKDYFSFADRGLL